MRPASRVVRLLVLVAVALSVGWLLLRRRMQPGSPTLRAVPDLPVDAIPAPRNGEPAGSAPRPAEPGPVGSGLAEPGPIEPGMAAPGVAAGVAGSVEPGPVEPRAPEPVSALHRPVHDTADAASAVEAVPAPAAPGPAAPGPVPPPPPEVAVAPAAVPAPAPVPPEEAMPTAVSPVEAADPVPAPVPVSTPAPTDTTPDTAPDQEQTDDLRRIRGVGPTIESALHRLGIRSYRQLVALDEEGLDRVRDALRDFRQRIEREDWIGQARRLHLEKYGEEV